MAFFENCVERTTALAVTCGWLALGGGAEAAVGVAIGGAGLAALVSDAARRHGPESAVALKLIRERISTDLHAYATAERWDNRADLEAADAAMERALVGCFLDRRALAASARSALGFPGAAGKLILAKLAEREPNAFGENAPETSRDFAQTVIRTALEAAIDNEEYFKGIQPHLLIEMLRGIGTLEMSINNLQTTVSDMQKDVRTLKGLSAQIDGFTRVLQQHLTAHNYSRVGAGQTMRRAAALISLGKFSAAENLFQSAIDEIYSDLIEPGRAAVVEINIERAKTFLLQSNVDRALPIYASIVSDLDASDPTTWLCRVAGFAGISFLEQEMELIRPSIRGVVFESERLLGAVSFLRKNLKTPTVASVGREMDKTVASYIAGDSWRTWSMYAESAGDALMRTAQDSGDPILADLALLGYEYMAQSFYTSDDPIDIQSNRERMIRAIMFLRGNKNPTEEEVEKANPYEYLG